MMSTNMGPIFGGTHFMLVRLLWDSYRMILCVILYLLVDLFVKHIYLYLLHIKPVNEHHLADETVLLNM